MHLKLYLFEASILIRGTSATFTRGKINTFLYLYHHLLNVQIRMTIVKVQFHEKKTFARTEIQTRDFRLI